MNRRWVLLAAAAACRSSSAASPPEARGGTATTGGATLVELFTSEGCSSCPPADEVLASLDTNANVVALGFHVDYWDSLGWPDRFASPDFTERQRAYSRAFGTSSLYTPQMIIGGTDAFNGSDARHAGAALARAVAGPVSITLHARFAAAEAVVVDFDAPSAPPGSVIGLAVTELAASTDVRAGENAGRVLRHTDVVRAFATARAPSGRVTLHVSRPLPAANARVVAFVQRERSEGPGMPVLGVLARAIEESPPPR